MPTPRGERLLVISRLLPYKRVDVIVSAATRLGIGLDVVGDGFMLPRLRALAGPGVVFHGAVDDATVVELMQSCRAVCIAAEEDFGIVALEAQAAGKPVIAYGRGGAWRTSSRASAACSSTISLRGRDRGDISEADRLDAPPKRSRPASRASPTAPSRSDSAARLARCTQAFTKIPVNLDSRQAPRRRRWI